MEDNPTGAPEAAKRVITYAYDAAGQRRRMAIDTGEAVEYRWDSVGRLLETVDPQGETTRFGYDAAGRRTSATYGNGTRATWAYDAVGQVLSIAYLDSAGGVQTAFGYEYDAAGNRTHKAFANGTKEEYGYDGLNRLVRAKYPTDRVVEYAYDGVGNRTWMADTGKGTKTRWAVSATASSTYHPASSAVGPPDNQYWQAQGGDAYEWIEMSFGTPERATALRIREAQNAPFVVRVDLIDEAGTSHTVYSGADATPAGGWLVIPVGFTAYKVAKAKIVTSGMYEAIDAVGLDLPSPETYAYNGFNQLETVAAADGALTTFGYDGSGNQRTKSVRTGWVTQTTTYGYDQDNRLRTVTTPSGPAAEPTVQWAASATASSEAQSGTQAYSAFQSTGPPSNNACTADGLAWAPQSYTSPQWLEVEYAAPAKSVGVRIHESYNAGEVTKVELIDEGGTARTVWTGTDPTPCGQWLEVSFPETEYRVKAVKVSTAGPTQENIDAVGIMSAPPEGATTTTTYAYDANGLRVSKSDTSGETRYLLDGLSVVAQYAPDGARQAFYVQSLARIDEVLSVVNSAGKFWYQADALGSVYTLTTAAGDVRARGGYDVFGEPAAEYGQQVGQPFGFTGREHELESGLVYARARYLSPSMGRWDRADPLGLRGGLNLYMYAEADPVSLSDPMGLQALPVPVPPPPPYLPPANQPMRARGGIVLDTVSAYALYHTAAFIALLADLGAISEEVSQKIAKDCDDNKDTLEEFWRGDSYDRAVVSATTGFLSAGIGIEPGQLGPGLYMSRERSVGLRYAQYRKREFGRGAVLDILIRTSIWKAVLNLGAVDGLPIAGEAGTQAYVPTGMALGLFDSMSWKFIDEVL